MESGLDESRATRIIDYGSGQDAVCGVPSHLAQEDLKVSMSAATKTATPRGRAHFDFFRTAGLA